MVYISPNMLFVPEPHNGEEELHTWVDGQFGTTDCFQWPQIYCKEYEYTICIARRECHPHPDPLAWAWYMATPNDFEVLPTAAFAVGKLKQEKAVGVTSLSHITLKWYTKWKKNCGDKKDIMAKVLQSLQLTAMILLQHPLTFHDVITFVTQAQWMFLNIYAFLDFVEVVLPHSSFPTNSHPVRSDWMGCFTQDPIVCNELFYTGVPVWFIHLKLTITDQTIIKKPVMFTFPDHITHAMYSKCGRTVQPFDLCYHGSGGLKQHVYLRQYYAGHMNPSPTTPLSSTLSTSNISKAPTHTQTRKAKQKRHSCQHQRQSSKCHDI